VKIKTVSGSVEFDDNKRTVLVKNKGMFKKDVSCRYDDILSFDLIDEGTTVTSGGLGRALVGGALFGPLGALVGGTTGKKKQNTKCERLQVSLTINNQASPIAYMDIVTVPLPRKSMAFQNALKDAEKIMSKLEVICHENEAVSQYNQQQYIAAPVSGADEIMRFKALADSGVISQEEFETKKRQLLGI